jgi:hypothetical protein
MSPKLLVQVRATSQPHKTTFPNHDSIIIALLNEPAEQAAA